jgi:septal ring factor EnvC (AmiA/AmiB activator)
MSFLRRLLLGWRIVRLRQRADRLRAENERLREEIAALAAVAQAREGRE